MWAHKNECNMTNIVAGNIIEKCYESRKLTYAQMRQVRRSLSYSYYLREGVCSDNWPEVKAQWHSFDMTTLPGPKARRMPTDIPTPHNLKAAATKPWTPASEWSLTWFSTGVIANYDSNWYGLRPNVDIRKVKFAEEHFVNVNEGYGWTEMFEGRAKLPLQKRKTRPWKVFRVCLCPNGKHVPVPDDIVVDKDGNPFEKPTWHTYCPIAAMEFIRNVQQRDDWQIYPKWFNRAGRYGKGKGSNIADVAKFANEWLNLQGVKADEGRHFSRNCGRKSLARWLDHLDIPYTESMPIHGDNEDVWVDHYQDNLATTKYRVRKQSHDPDICCKALRKFARWCRSDDGAPAKPLNREEKLSVAILERLGGANEVKKILMEE